MDLISTDSLSDDQIATLFDLADRYAVQNRQSLTSTRLAGKTVFNVFYESSTRTAMSFAVAAVRLGAQPLTLSVERSSVKKGETLGDTVQTLAAMLPDAVVIRHRETGAAEEVAAMLDCPVINAGDGIGEHPTQALLDALTLRQHFGRLEGLTVAICGDIVHSRVAHSNLKLLPRLGVTVRVAGPPELLPDGSGNCSGLDEALNGADAIMMLRIQRERAEHELGDAPGEYLSTYGLTLDRLGLAAPHAVILHPGPMNRGVEITDEVADHPRSLILRQVENGVAMRMAVLDLLVGA